MFNPINGAQNPVRYSLNNGQALNNLRDYQVGQLIRRVMPANTFSSVHVCTVNYQFPTQTNFIRARKITLYRSSLSVTWQSVKFFFLSLFSPTKRDSLFDDNRMVNPQLIGCFLGRDIGMNEDDLIEAEKDLMVVFRRCSNLTIYISDDCRWLHADPIARSKMVEVGIKVGSALRIPFDK